jgi:hypothetical protein
MVQVLRRRCVHVFGHELLSTLTIRRYGTCTLYLYLNPAIRPACIVYACLEYIQMSYILSRVFIVHTTYVNTV